MELLEGRKYKNRNKEKSIMDIKVDDIYTVYVFKGTLSKNDIVIKYSKFGRRMRTPKHIHWVIDMLLKEQKNHNDVISFIKCMQETWDEILGLENNDYETLKETLLKYKNKIDTKISKLTLEGRRVSN
jgi:low affinity Fe/Cu permease